VAQLYCALRGYNFLPAPRKITLYAALFYFQCSVFDKPVIDNFRLPPLQKEGWPARHRYAKALAGGGGFLPITNLPISNLIN
jgi:hypothetical protein